MQTANNKEELTDAIVKMIIVATLFLAGFFLNFLESITL